MDRNQTSTKETKAGLSQSASQKTTQTITNARKFVILFKKYTNITEPELFQLCSRHFTLQEDDFEELSPLFLLEEIREAYLREYASGLKVPIALRGLELEQAKAWLTSYSPRLWHLIEQGELSLPDDEPVRHNEEQARFLIELRQFLPWVEIARAFAHEFHTNLVKNLASELFRVDKRRSEISIWASYARQTANGILFPKDAEAAEYWLQKYVTGSKGASMTEVADDEGGQDAGRFDQHLFIEEMRSFLSWKALAGPYCTEFNTNKTWQQLARNFLWRKSRDDWIEFQRYRDLHGLNTRQKDRVKKWLEAYVSEDMREKALLAQQEARAKWAQDRNEYANSDAFIVGQIEAGDSSEHPSARILKDTASATLPERPRGRQRRSIIRHSSLASRTSPYKRTKRPANRQEQVSEDDTVTIASHEGYTNLNSYGSGS